MRDASCGTFFLHTVAGQNQDTQNLLSKPCITLQKMCDYLAGTWAADGLSIVSVSFTWDSTYEEKVPISNKI